jgi:hypothetical protein
MSILNQSQSPPILTTELKQQRASAALQQGCQQLYRTMLMTYNNMMNLVWKNPGGLTPQQVFDGLGTKAGELVRLGSLLKETLNAAEAGTVQDIAGPTLVVNEDGTVTVGN